MGSSQTLPLATATTDYRMQPLAVDTDLKEPPSIAGEAGRDEFSKSTTMVTDATKIQTPQTTPTVSIDSELSEKLPPDPDQSPGDSTSDANTPVSAMTGEGIIDTGEVDVDEDNAEVAKDTKNAPKTATTSTKCIVCSKRVAREGCTMTACLQCCTDDSCESHRKPKANALWKAQVLEGTTDTQLLVKQIRSRAVCKGRFREKGFRYQGDTIVIWDLRQYMRNQKWRDDAIRKSARRNAREECDGLVGKRTFRKPLGNSRKRFHRLIEEHHQRSKVVGNAKADEDAR